jgi:hypothetical protein
MVMNKPAHMHRTNRVIAAFERFSAWFDHRFGWFFTNGMKDRRAHQ